jgi:hypothetical protein
VSGCHLISPAAGCRLTVFIVDNSLHFVKNFIRFILKGLATHVYNSLYQDGARYWCSTQPTVTKLAEDRAEQLKRDPDKVVQEFDKRLRADLRKMSDFKRMHPTSRPV